ncbi:type I restriction-modification system [Psychrobacter sp. JCM 18903]|nr:type I restriction-modification system [Psychrobacter sp. JCM 18903]
MPVPPFPEQQKIAKILSTWDKAIGATERLIENSTQQKKALMQQLLTGKKRLLDESGKRFEGEWEEVKLGDVSDVRDGTHDSPEFIDVGYPLITSKNLLSSGRLDLSNVKLISEEDYLQINKRSNVNNGDILFGMIGTIGNPVRVKSSNYAIKNVALIKETGILLNSFLIYYLSSHDIDKQIYRLNAGGTQKFVALGVLRNLVVSLPTQKEQQKIATVLTNADKEIELLEQQLADLQQEKKALMQVLLTGKKRVVVDGEVA